MRFIKALPAGLTLVVFLFLPAAAGFGASCTSDDSLTVRNGHALAYHVGQNAVVMFGGADERQVLGDLWAWDGDTWRCITTSGPPARTFPALAYSDHENRLVLFGGNRVLFGTDADTATFLDDFWSWDAASGWQLIDTQTPSARAEASIAYDMDRRRVVLFGGYRIANGETVRLGDTWEWDGDTWEQMSSDGPPPRNGTAMTYDVRRKRMVLFGGSGVPGETWEWNGSQWRESEAPTVEGRFNTAMEYDAGLEVVVRFGGWTGDDRIGDTWVFDGTEWYELHLEGPAPRNHSALTYNARRKVLVLFGGHDGDQIFGDTWELNGNDWTMKSEIAPRLRINNGH